MVLEALRRRVAQAITPRVMLGDMESLYVGGFGSEIRTVVDELWTKEEPMTAHFVPKRRLVEFRTPHDGTIATLTVHGECGTPHTAYVSPREVSGKIRESFVRHFQSVEVLFRNADEIPGCNAAH